MAVEVLHAPRTLVSNSSTNTVASGTTWVQLMSLTLDPGTWLVVGDGSFASNGTGRRGLRLSWGSSASETSYAVPVSGANTTMQRIRLLRLANATNMALLAIQNSGAALSVTGKIYAVRLA